MHRANALRDDARGFVEALVVDEDTGAGILEAVLALESLRRRIVPGIATFAVADPACTGVRVSAEPQSPRSDVILVLCRGFAGTNAALLLRASV